MAWPPLKTDSETLAPLTARPAGSDGSGALIVAFLTIIALTVAPFRLTSLASSEPVYVGVASSRLTITSYGLMLLIGTIWALPWTQRSARYRRGFVVVLPMLAYVVLASAILWNDSLYIRLGILHIFLAAAAWCLGCRASRVFVDGPHYRLTAKLSVAICGLLAASVYAQVLGEEASDQRATGLFGHPSTTGKIVLILLILLLPMTVAKERTVRRCGSWAIVLGALAIAPTLSRANIVGLAIGVLVWVLLIPRGPGLLRRLAIPSLLSIGFLPFLGALLERFESDPDGGSRPGLLAAGIRQIKVSPLVGTGPNAFVPTTLETEAIVASTGSPIHNAFLLAIAELGIIGALTFFLPVVACLVVAVRKCRKDGPSAVYARSTIAGIAALVFVAQSGWGLIQQPILQLWYFILGVAFTAIRSGHTEAPSATRTRHT